MWRSGARHPGWSTVVLTALAAIALGGCGESLPGTTGPPPPSADPPLPGETVATITGGLSADFEGGSVFMPGDQGFRIRAQGSGSTSNYFMEFREYDRVGEIEAGEYAIVEAWSYFDPGSFTVTLIRSFPGGREQYQAVDGELELSPAGAGELTGSFSFSAERRWVCEVDAQGTECDPRSGPDEPRIEVTGSFQSVSSGGS